MKHVGAVLIPARRRKSERARPYFTRYRKYLIIYEHLQNSSHRTQTVAAKTRRGPLWGGRTNRYNFRQTWTGGAGGGIYNCQHGTRGSRRLRGDPPTVKALAGTTGTARIRNRGRLVGGWNDFDINARFAVWYFRGLFQDLVYLVHLRGFWGFSREKLFAFEPFRVLDCRHKLIPFYDYKFGRISANRPLSYRFWSTTKIQFLNYSLVSCSNDVYQIQCLNTSTKSKQRDMSEINFFSYLTLHFLLQIMHTIST